ncbi:Hsp20/alpha crystallin family protein [Variovorax sp. N23]|uniref:Hsp20/alpha crystallin family protein n=1 Tax=Variovorax sp. N23 TaxID=2980555 RepID=UPI0021C87213|nr:Hsp20 family protein [Variovorax sp. N23]MCU4117699.1 Hsp20 family protein [Variovorax sp. N23]MCU4119930.1 Hsp20 family protein [Variovorax sp. N23]
MTTLARLDRIENLFPELMRRWARPLQMLDDTDIPADLRVDVSENDHEYLVSAEIPGAKKEDIRVSIDGNYVSITAEIKKEQEEKHGRSLVKETYHGSVSRGFTLASDVDEKSAVAKLEDGVLRLTLPKREGTTSRLLQIQ